MSKLTGMGLSGSGLLGILAVGYVITSAGGTATDEASGLFGGLLSLAVIAGVAVFVYTRTRA